MPSNTKIYNLLRVAEAKNTFLNQSKISRDIVKTIESKREVKRINGFINKKNKLKNHTFFNKKNNVNLLKSHKFYLEKETNILNFYSYLLSLNISEININSYLFNLEDFLEKNENIKIYSLLFQKNEKKKKEVPISDYEKNTFDNVLKTISIPPPIGPNQTSLYKPLWDSQKSGAEFLISQKTALLADDPGLGKTVQAIVALKVLFHKGYINNALIVVPKSTLGDAKISKETGDALQWAGHIEMWAPEMKVKIIEPKAWVDGKPPPGFSGDTSADRLKEWYEPAHIYLTTYSLIRNDINKGHLPTDRFDCIVLDEAQNIKNPNSQQSQALRSMDAEYKWALTGTPVENAVKDLYGIFQFLRPEEFPSLPTKRLETLDLSRVTEVTKEYTIRREKKEDDLPPKINNDIWCSLSKSQSDAYSGRYTYRISKLKKLLQDDASDIQFKKSAFAAITDLKQICNFSPVEDTSPKIELLLPIVEEKIQQDEKILIFSQYVNNGINRIFPHIEKYGTQLIYGEMSNSERNESIDIFKRDKDTNILLCSLRSAGVGLNLTEASTVIHFDHWWNPAVMWQAEDRAHRYGQKKEVNVYSFWVKGTIEEKIFNILKKKKELINKVLKEIGGSSQEREIDNLLSRDDWIDIFEI